MTELAEIERLRRELAESEAARKKNYEKYVEQLRDQATCLEVSANCCRALEAENERLRAEAEEWRRR